MGLTQCVTNATRGENILGLMSWLHPKKLDYCYCNPPITKSDQGSVLFNVLVEKHKQMNRKQYQSASFDKVNFLV